jgi:hypothetical protein
MTYSGLVAIVGQNEICNFMWNSISNTITIDGVGCITLDNVASAIYNQDLTKIVAVG